jgi:polyhydroxyalkanoate synthase
VNQGIDVYLVDWGVPGEEHGKLTFDYYIDTFLRRCVRKVLRRTGSEKINLMGQCLGGTLAAVYAAVHPEQINKLICMTTPIDFEDAGLLSVWTDSKTFDIDKIVESYGSVIPADFIHACFQYLDVKATVQSYKKLYNNVLDENFLYYYRALDAWLKDKIPFPALVFGKFIKELYQENRLAKGTFTINGKTANLENITCPVLNIASQFDHVFPEKSAKALDDLVGGESEYHLIPAGHVTLVVLFPQRFETFRIMSEFILRD